MSEFTTPFLHEGAKKRRLHQMGDKLYLFLSQGSNNNFNNSLKKLMNFEMFDFLFAKHLQS